MLKSLTLSNFTMFKKTDLRFAKHLNVIVGENGTGKTHILKAAYTGLAVSAQRSRENLSPTQNRNSFTQALIQKLEGVFRPDAIGRLVRRARGRNKGSVSYKFSQAEMDFTFTVSTLSNLHVDDIPSSRVKKYPVFIPTRELLTIAPGFVSLYETSHLPFEETWRDTCLLLQAPLVRGPRERGIGQLLPPLESAMGGKLSTDKGGRFYLELDSGKMEIHLVAEGLRKLGMVARLMATGSLLNRGYLFWDEPEANLNAAVIKVIARTILHLANSGIQIFIASHSLFLLRELHILQQGEFSDVDSRYFGLHFAEDGAVLIDQGKTIDEIGDITALEEDLKQADRYMAAEMSSLKAFSE